MSGAVVARSAGSVLNYSGVAALTAAEITQGASRVLSFIDLGGHERFLKTALYGGRLEPLPCFAVTAAARSSLLGQHLLATDGSLNPQLRF